MSAALCVFGLSIQAPAAMADDHEIIVTGQTLYADQVNALKSPTPIIDVPQSLSIVTADQIDQQGFTSVADIIDYTPGVNTSQGEGHRDAVVFRGVRSTADFFIDGVRDDVQYYRSLYNLEQVEILRGPNALLFGRGGTGGLINRVTKKGVIGENFLGYKASINSLGARDVQLDANIDTGETSALRINGFYEGLNNHRDFFSGDRFGVNPTAKVALTPSTLLDVSYEYSNFDRFIDRGIPTANGEPVEGLTDIVFGDPELNGAELEAHLFRAGLDHKFSDNFKGVLSANYGIYDKLYRNFFANDYDPVTNTAELDGYVDTTQRRNLTLAGTLIGEVETGSIGHTLVAGAEFIDTVNNNDRFNPVFTTAAADGRRTDRENFVALRPIDFSGGAGTAADGRPTSITFTDLNDDTEADVRVFSAFIQDEIAISDWLDVIVGARFDSFEIDVLDLAVNEQRSRKDDEVSPRLGVVLKPRENISVYGSFSRSFLPRSGEQFANINGNNDALDPNRFTNLEGGLKWDLDSSLSLTAAVFEIEQSSPQVADNDPSTLDVIDSQTRGFEIQALGQITDNWFVSAGYSYLDGEIVDRLGPTGYRPRELPAHIASLWNKYQVTDRFGVGLGVTYQDESFVNNSNSAALPSYARVDAAAYYDVREDLRLQVNVENVTDETYFPNAHSTHQVTVGAPLNAKFTVSGRF